MLAVAALGSASCQDSPLHLHDKTLDDFQDSPLYHRDKTLAKWGVRGIRLAMIQEMGSSLETMNLVEVTTGHEYKDEEGEDNFVNIDSVKARHPIGRGGDGAQLTRSARRAVVRLGADNRPYLFYADTKVVRKVKVRTEKKVPAAPLDVRMTPEEPRRQGEPRRQEEPRRRPRLVLINDQGQAMAPKLMHLNERIKPIYTFKSR